MRIMEEEKVRRYLDDLLVELEVFGSNDVTRDELNEKFVRTINFYKDNYPHILEEYKNRANEILTGLKR